MPPKKKSKKSAKTKKLFFHFRQKIRKGEDFCFRLFQKGFLKIHQKISKKITKIRENPQKTFFLFLKGFGVATIFLATLFLIFQMHFDRAIFREINLYDEGVTLFGAKRFLAGEMPYRDFWTIYGPLKFPLLAAIFKFFGTNILVARGFFFAVSLAAFSLFFVLFYRRGGAIFAAIATIFLAFFGLFSLTPFFLAAIFLAFSFFLENPRGRFSAIFLGFSIGLLFLLRLDFGLLAGGGVFLATLFVFFFDFKKTFLPAIFKMAIGFFAVVAPVFAALFFVGALPDWFSDAVVFPLFGKYRELRALPWPAIDPRDAFSDFSVDFLALSRFLGNIFWIFPFGFAVVFIFSQILKKTFSRQKAAEIFLFAVFVFGAFLYAHHRADAGHLLFLNALALAFLFLVAADFGRGKFSVFAVAALVALAPATDLFFERFFIEHAPRQKYSFLPKKFPESRKLDDLQKVVDFFAPISPDKKVFVGVSDTSRIFVNNIILPFVLAQKPATAWHEMHPGIVTRRDIQQKMIAEMAAADFVVLWDYFLCEPNKSCVSSGNFALDDFRKTHFQKVAEFGKYKILKKIPEKKILEK